MSILHNIKPQIKLINTIFSVVPITQYKFNNIDFKWKPVDELEL